MYREKVSLFFFHLKYTTQKMRLTLSRLGVNTYITARANWINMTYLKKIHQRVSFELRYHVCCYRYSPILFSLVFCVLTHSSRTSGRPRSISQACRSSFSPPLLQRERWLGSIMQDPECSNPECPFSAWQ